MTNGDPVVVRAAMKPLPTLTQAAAQRRHRHQGPLPRCGRTDSCSAAAGHPSGGDGGAGTGRRHREAGRDHRRHQGSPARLRGAHRLGRLRRDRPGRLHGRRASPPAPGRSQPSWADRRSTPTARSRRASGSNRVLLRPPWRGGVPRAGGGVVCEVLAARTLGDRARRRRRPVRARPGRHPPDIRSCTSRSTWTTPGAAPPARAGRLPATRAASSRSGATAGRWQVGVRRSSSRRRTATPCRRAPFVLALRRPRPGPGWAGRRRVGRLPGLPGPRPDRVRASSRRWAGAASWSPTSTSRGCSAWRATSASL